MGALFAGLGMAKRNDFASANIIFVLGGPGAGKGTLCAELVQQFGFAHFSAGDLLRKAAKEDTDLGHELSQLMKGGSYLPRLLSDSSKTPSLRPPPRTLSLSTDFPETSIKEKNSSPLLPSAAL